MKGKKIAVVVTVLILVGCLGAGLYQLENYDEFLSKLEEYNINNRYTDDLRLLRAHFKKAMSRETSKGT